MIASPSVALGALRLFVWLAIFAVVATIPILVLPWFGHQLAPLEMIPFALPGAYLLVRLMEVIIDVPFFEFARRWDELKGWQRGILGTFIVLVAGVVIIAAIGGIVRFFVVR